MGYDIPDHYDSYITACMRAPVRIRSSALQPAGINCLGSKDKQIDPGD